MTLSLISTEFEDDMCNSRIIFRSVEKTISQLPIGSA